MFIFWLWTFNCLLGCVSHFHQRNSSVCSNSIREASEQFVKICEICIVIVFTGNFEQISYSPRISLMLTLNRFLFIRLLKIVLGSTFWRFFSGLALLLWSLLLIFWIYQQHRCELIGSIINVYLAESVRILNCWRF